MSNEIKSLLPMEPRRNGPVQGSAPAQKPGGPGQGDAGRASVEEKVTLTEAGRKIANMSAEASQGAPVDEAKVRQVREAIESGRYQADAAAIARALMSFEQDS
jgi:flagellar biosynthesis anti-sigma factor FlgM